jgi:hypothetical protein
MGTLQDASEASPSGTGIGTSSTHRPETTETYSRERKDMKSDSTQASSCGPVSILSAQIRDFKPSSVELASVGELWAEA